MANAAKVAGKILTLGDFLHVLPFYGLGDDSEKKAREAAEKQKAIEEQGLDYAKDVADTNRDIWAKAATDVLGHSPVSAADVAQRQQEQADWDAKYGPNGSQTGANAPTAYTPQQQQGWWDDYRAYAQQAIANDPTSPPLSYDAWASGQNGMDPSMAPTTAQLGTVAAPPARPEDLTEYDPNQDPNALQGAYHSADAELDTATQQLKDVVAGIKDPTIQDYVGDVMLRGSQIHASPEDMAREKQAADQLQGLTTTKETAEEKLMREMARRKMENQLQSDRFAAKQSLQNRGVYGSGAEIAMGGQSMQEAASRRALEEMAANANAQNRSMSALGKFSDLSSKMRGEDVDEAQKGATLDQVADMFNKGTQEQHNQWKTKQDADDNRDAVTRATIARDAVASSSGSKAGHAQNLANTEIALASGATGSNIAGANVVIPSNNRLGSYWGTEALKADAQTPQPGMLGDWADLFKS